jgi:hypothetical protein
MGKFILALRMVVEKTLSLTRVQKTHFRENLAHCSDFCSHVRKKQITAVYAI